MDCPELAALEAVPLAPAVREHVSGCSSCQMVVDVFDRVGPLNLEECARFDALLAARSDGTLGRAGRNLLDRHLASCSTCRVVADTLSPTQDAHGDHEHLPRVDPDAYALGLEVARGGMGRILAARDLRVGRPVAVKELLGRSPQLAARFEREARVTARLQHPGIVPIYEIGKWPDGTPFYSMRMVDGDTLRTKIDRTANPTARIALLAPVIAACEAVAFAHGQRVIHRDLTPSNILVGQYGETVVIDWGLAKDLTETSADDVELADPYRTEPEGIALTAAGIVVGTAAYMPPEQARAESVDERADVYALGAILYHVLAGTPPYKEDKHTLAEVKAGPPAPIDAIAPETPRDLVSIIGKAMARDPEARYPSARELAEELKRFQTGRMVEAHVYSRGELVRRFLRRNRAPLVVTATAALVVMAVATLALVNIFASRNEARETVRELLLEKGRIELLNGNTIPGLAYLFDAYQNGARGPALQFLLGRAVESLSRSEKLLDCGGDGRALEFSPDGTMLAAACNNVLKIWPLDATTKNPPPIVTLGPIQNGFDWLKYSHDGATIATYGREGVARLWNARTGALVGTYRHGAEITYTTFTPDDKTIATSGFDGVVRLWNLANPSAPVREIAVPTLPILSRISGVLSGDGKLLYTVTIDGIAQGWDVETGQLLGTSKHGSIVLGGDLSADRTYAVTCGINRLAKVWDARTGALVKTIAGHVDVVWKCMLSPDNTRVLTTSHDGAARVWDIATGTLITSVNHGDIVWGARFAPDGRRFVTTGFAGGVKVWDTDTGAPLASHDSLRGRDAWFSPDGAKLVTMRGDGRIEIWGESSTRQAFFSASSSGSGTRIAAVSADGMRVATESSDGWITLRDTRTNKALAHEAIVAPIAANPTTQGDTQLTRFAATSGRAVIVIDAASGRTVAKLAIGEAPRGLSFAGDGRHLVVLAGGAPQIWDVDRATKVAQLDGANALLSDDGRLALTWTRPTAFTVWDVATRTRGAVLVPANRAAPIGFGLKGDRVALVETDVTPHAVTLFDTTSGARILEQDDASRAPAFDPTGRYLTTIAADRTVTVWDAKTGKPHRSFPVEQLQQIQASPDGELVAAISSYGGALRVISALDGRELAHWPIDHAAPVIKPGAFEPPAGLAWWTHDGRTIVSQSRGVAVWSTGAVSPEDVADLVRTKVPWRVDNGKLELIRDAKLSGKVLRDGNPVDNAQLRLEIRTRPDIGFAEANWESMKTRVANRDTATRKSGTFELTDLVPGEYLLTVEIDGRVARTLDVQVTAENDPFEIDLGQ